VKFNYSIEFEKWWDKNKALFSTVDGVVSHFFKEVSWKVWLAGRVSYASELARTKSELESNY